MATTIRQTSSRTLSRLRLEQSRLDDVTFIVADGLFEAARVIVEKAAAQAPDSPFEPYPEGEGLPKQGGVLVYAGNKKTHGWSIRGDQPAKPRAVRASTKEHSVVAVLGFGFPGRFAEGGTVNHAAQPFLAPARDSVGVEGVANIVGEVTRPRLAGPR